MIQSPLHNYLMETVDNRKNLFIQITEGVKQQSLNQVINNWGRPTPFQYHLINSPSLNFELATLPAQLQKSKIEFFPQKNREFGRGPRRNGERERYKRLREEIHVLEQGLRKSGQLHESELLAYKQKLLVQYLGRFVEETGAQCIEKAEFIKTIWNLLVRVFEGLCERLVAQGKRRQKQFLRDELGTHCSYQAKLEQYQAQNSELKQSDDKYQGIVKQLMTNIAKLNAELKGQRSLFDRTAASLTELTHKYGQLRSQYLQILVNGYSETMSRQHAEANLTDKELLLFARQLTNGNHGVRAKKGRQRKERVVTNDLDVGLLLQELQAENQYSFQLDAGEKKQVTFANQRTQTNFVGYQGENMGIQCDYVSRSEEGQIRNRSSQTNPPSKITQRQAQYQTNPSELLQRQLEVTRCFSFNHYPIRIEPRQSIKLFRNSSKQNGFQAIGNRKIPPMQDAATCISYQTLQDENARRPSITQTPCEPPLLEKRESKMVRISDSRQSKRLSKNILLRVKTEANQFSGRNSRAGKRGSKDLRVSQFLALQNLRQSMIKNVSSFKKSQIAATLTFQMKFRRQLLADLDSKKPLRAAIVQALEPIEADTRQRERQYMESVRNVQLSSVNQGVREKITTWEGLNNRKIASFLPAHKCLRGIGEVYKLAKRFIAIGCNSLNLVTLTCEWLSAVDGKPVSLQNNPKKLLDFLRSCINLYGEHYLIRNFVLLCGLEQPGKDDRLVKMSKISFDSLKQRVDGNDRLNRTSDFKFHRETRETQDPQHPQAYLLYASEVALYFDLLDALNCSDSRQDLSRYYTTYDRFEEIIPRLNIHYRNSLQLLAQIREAVRLSVQDWGSESQSKLNIFKCLQLVIERVLTYKGQIEAEFAKIQEQSGEEGLTEDLVELSGISASQFAQTLAIAHQCYPKATPCDVATLFLVEGLKIDLGPFSIVEKDHKVTIIKRLIANKQKQRGLALHVLQSFQKRTMKKTDFHLLLRNIWTKQSQNTLDAVLGQDMFSLYTCSVPYGESEAGVGFHRAMREALRLW